VPEQPSPASPPTLVNRGGPLAYQEVVASATTSARFTKPDTWQIVSAGKDKQFGSMGPKGVWSAALGVWDPTKGQSDLKGRDDQSNFSPNVLATPQ